MLFVVPYLLSVGCVLSYSRVVGYVVVGCLSCVVLLFVGCVSFVGCYLFFWLSVVL